MPTDAPREVRRGALVLARHGARAAAPPGVDGDRLARAALADSYEVLADLVDVLDGIVGPPEVAELLWPGGLLLPDVPVLELTSRLAPDLDELVLVPADVPDLPGLVLAKVFKVLHRSDVVVAPERGGAGCVAVGLRLPVAPWLSAALSVVDLDLDDDPYTRWQGLAPDRAACVRSVDWHRLRTPEGLRRLDPGLEGWEETRALLDEA